MATAGHPGGRRIGLATSTQRAASSCSAAADRGEVAALLSYLGSGQEHRTASQGSVRRWTLSDLGGIRGMFLEETHHGLADFFAVPGSLAAARSSQISACRVASARAFSSNACRRLNWPRKYPASAGTPGYQSRAATAILRVVPQPSSAQRPNSGFMAYAHVPGLQHVVGSTHRPCPVPARRFRLAHPGIDGRRLYCAQVWRPAEAARSDSRRPPRRRILGRAPAIIEDSDRTMRWLRSNITLRAAARRNQTSAAAPGSRATPALLKQHAPIADLRSAPPSISAVISANRSSCRSGSGHTLRVNSVPAGAAAVERCYTVTGSR